MVDRVTFGSDENWIQTQSTDRLVDIRDSRVPLLAPAQLALYEWTDYWLRFPGATRLRVGDRIVQPIDDRLFQVRLENQLGLTTLQPLDDWGPFGPAIHVEVLSPKFATIEQHVAFLSSLLDDLFARAARLPFTVAADTARGVTESPAAPSPLFTLHFLIQHAAEVREAWNVIQARPHRRLADHPEMLPIAEASEADADVLLSVITSPETWVPARGFPLATRLRGYAPERIWQRRPEESLDTPENRFVKAFLRSLLAAADALPTQLFWKHVSSGRQRIVTDSRAVLERSLADPLFAEVGEMRHIPASSRVLMRREGYRQVLGLWRLFHLARRPLFGALQRAIDLRSVDQLYEMWCFFALVEEIQVSLGVSPDLHLDVSDEHGLGWKATARFGTEGWLVYNQSKRGYSVWLRPDFLWYRHGTPEVAFDAKFRLDRRVFDDGTDETTVKKDDLYKMHTYRDALGLRAALVVYPGSEARFWAPQSGGIEVDLNDVLSGEATGVGTLAFHPDTLR